LDCDRDEAFDTNAFDPDAFTKHSIQMHSFQTHSTENGWRPPVSTGGTGAGYNPIPMRLTRRRLEGSRLESKSAREAAHPRHSPNITEARHPWLQ
jgi:hypothetical protein